MKEKNLYVVEIGETDIFTERYYVLARSIEHAIEKAKRRWEEIHGNTLGEVFEVEFLGEVVE